MGRGLCQQKTRGISNGPEREGGGEGGYINKKTRGINKCFRKRGGRGRVLCQQQKNKRNNQLFHGMFEMGCSSVGTTSDRHSADAGLIPGAARDFSP